MFDFIKVAFKQYLLRKAHNSFAPTFMKLNISAQHSILVNFMEQIFPNNQQPYSDCKVRGQAQLAPVKYRLKTVLKTRAYKAHTPHASTFKYIVTVLSAQRVAKTIQLTLENMTSCADCVNLYLWANQKSNPLIVVIIIYYLNKQLVM